MFVFPLTNRQALGLKSFINKLETSHLVMEEHNKQPKQTKKKKKRLDGELSKKKLVEVFTSSAYHFSNCLFIKIFKRCLVFCCSPSPGAVLDIIRVLHCRLTLLWEHFHIFHHFTLLAYWS